MDMWGHSLHSCIHSTLNFAVGYALDPIPNCAVEGEVLRIVVCVLLTPDHDPCTPVNSSLLDNHKDM